MSIAQCCPVLSGTVWGHACPIYSATDYRTCPLLSAVLSLLCSVELCGDISQCCSVLSGTVWGHACPIYSATDYRTCPLLSAVLCSVELHVRMWGHFSVLFCAQWHCVGTCLLLSAVHVHVMVNSSLSIKTVLYNAKLVYDLNASDLTFFSR